MKTLLSYLHHFDYPLPPPPPIDNLLFLRRTQKQKPVQVKYNRLKCPTKQIPTAAIQLDKLQ